MNTGALFRYNKRPLGFWWQGISSVIESVSNGRMPLHQSSTHYLFCRMLEYDVWSRWLRVHSCFIDEQQSAVQEHTVWQVSQGRDSEVELPVFGGKIKRNINYFMKFITVCWQIYFLKWLLNVSCISGALVSGLQNYMLIFSPRHLLGYAIPWVGNLMGNSPMRINCLYQ
jgi:hypothetical protein